MSFEGYFQRLCKNGHYSELDVYDPTDVPRERWKCDVCGEPLAWEKTVDQTNGTYCACPRGRAAEAEEHNPNFKCIYCGEDGRIDGYVELEMEEQSCLEAPATFKIPERVGHRYDDKEDAD